MKYDSVLIRISPEKINPYAVGHLINHPPPDTPANVKLIDFDLPITFFPSYMSKYFPILKRHEDHAFTRKQNETRTVNTLRAIAVVSLDTLKHDDELYVDYLEDERTEIDFTPDWLIKPPDVYPLL